VTFRSTVLGHLTDGQGLHLIGCGLLLLRKDLVDHEQVQLLDRAAQDRVEKCQLLR
jgi:hypothetical protein